MKKMIFIIAVFINNIVNGQINAYLNVGVEGNSGALVYPYEKAVSSFIVLPRQISFEMEYKLTKNIGISCFGEKKINEKGQLLGSQSRSEIYYWGIKNNITVFTLNKSFSMEMSPHLAYGKEKNKWEKSSFNLFSSNNSDEIKGDDKFDLLRVGLQVSLILTYNRFVFRGSFIYNYDFVIDGTRDLFTPEDEVLYDKFDYKGMFSRGIQLSMGIRLFGNCALQIANCKNESE